MVRIRQPKPRPHKIGTLNHLCRLLVPNCKLLIAAALLLLSSCTQHHRRFDPAVVAFNASCNPLYDNQLYPSLLLATNQTSQDNFNSQLSIFNLSVTSPADNSVLRVIVDSSALNYVTTLQEILPRRGQTYSFNPSIKWKYDILRRLRQPGAVDLTFTCYINDEQIDIKNLHLNYRTVNECPLSLIAPYNKQTPTQNKIIDFRWLFAAYVNEDHPYIQQILTDILSQGTVTRFTGYQNNNPQTVIDQAFAVWYYALDRGIAYSSITCTSNPSPRANVQHIRFFDEVYNTRQANCVDACVFFASILRKIGLKTVIFVEPCHAYLGFYTDRNRRNITLLETTITSWVNFPDLQRSLLPNGQLPENKYNKIAKYLTPQQQDDYLAGRITFDQLKLIIAHSLFDKATQYNLETHQANLQHFADSAAINYQQLDLDQLRSQVQPIN